MARWQDARMSAAAGDDVTIAEAYIAAVNRGDLESLTSLLAPDAVLKHPTGTYSGRVEISRFYTTVVFEGRAVTEIERLFEVDGVEILQLRATSPYAEPGAYVHAVDVFTVADDLVTQLEIYYR